MRNSLLTLFLALAVFFGSIHAYAVNPEHHGAHAGSTHSSAHADDLDTDSQEESEAQGQDVTHSHVAMDAVSDPRGASDRLFRTTSVLVIQDVMALPSLGIPPPLEPPSA